MTAPLRSYPDPSPASWPLVMAEPAPDAVADLRRRCEDVAARSQYGWGHTIDFGPFRQDGLLGTKYLQLAGVLDEWGWWPGDLSGRAVADVGCFTGGLAALMAARGAATVLAVDEIDEHLEQCRLVRDAFGLAGIETAAASLFDLQGRVAGGSLDLVLCAGVLYHLSDMLAGLMVLQRILRPGGLLVLETNAVECWEHSYANYGRYFGGMWWQPTALCVADMCEHAGLERPEVRFYQPGRALVSVRKPGDGPTGARSGGVIPFRRGVNLDFADRRDREERTLDPGLMAPAPCHHAEAGMIGRAASRAVSRLLQAPMRLGYRWRHRGR